VANPTLAFFFVSPFTALLVAAGAASIPIVVHLLNRNRYRVVTWAAMRFLLAAQRKNSRRMRLEQLILLLIRTAIVLLLVAAMASVMPWAEAFWSWAFPGHTQLAKIGTRRTHKILVIDGSFSMARKVGDANCFDRAKDMAMRVVQEGMGGDGFSVVLMASPPRSIVPEPSDDARRVAEEIQNLRLPHGNADLVGTLNTVEAMLRRSPNKFEEREVYFVTDMQRSTWTARQAANPLPALQKIQTQARCIFLNISPPRGSGRSDEFDNVAVSSVTLGGASGTPIATTSSDTLIQAVLQNYGTRPKDGMRVELLVGRARATSADAPFALRVVAESFETLAAGQSKSVIFRHKFGVAGTYVVQVRCDGDELDLDNTRAAVVLVKETVPVMLVNGKPAADPFERGTEFVRHALNPFAQGVVPRDVPARPKVLSESQFADAGLADLTPYDCVFLCDVARLSTGEVKRLETHLRRGGGVIVALGPHVDRDAYNRLLYREGKGILPARLREVKEAAEKQLFALHASPQSYAQAPLDAFVDDKDRGSLLNVRFRKYYSVDPVERAQRIMSFIEDPPSGPAAAAKDTEGKQLDPAVLAWNPPMPVVGGDTAAKPADARTRPQPAMQGRVVLITSTLNMDWTTWPVSVSYPPMIQELLRFAIAGRLREQAALVGDALEEFLPLSDGRLDVNFTLPDGRQEATRTEDREDVGVLRWIDTDQSGIYRAVIGQHPQEHLFAVNVPAATAQQQACESDLTRTNEDEIRATYQGWEFQVHTDLRDVSHTGGTASPKPSETGTGSQSDPDAGVRIATGGLGMALARYMLLVVLALLLIEVVLAWRFGHYSSAGQLESSGVADWRSVRIASVLVPALLYTGVCVVAAVLAHAAYTGDFLGFMPDTLRRGVESALGVPPPAPGEGTQWRLEFMPYLYDGASDPWLAGLIGIAAAVLVVFIYRIEGRSAGLFYRLSLGGLRIGCVVLALAVFLPQIRLWFERQGWPDVAILIDDSRSMSHVDHYQDAKVRSAADELAGIQGLTAPERLQLAQVLLTDPRRDWLHSLLKQRKVKVHIYHCSTKAARIADITDPADPKQVEQAIREIQALRADGESSALGGAVRQVLNDFRGSSLSAIIMLTDGVTSEGEDLSRVARYSSHLGVPLFFVGIGDDHDVRDLILHDLQVEDSVYVNDNLVFEVRLTGQGYTDLTVPVTLKEKGRQKVLAQQMVKIDPKGKPVKVRLVYRPTDPGEKTYVIEVPAQADEGPRTDNNRLERVVLVREAKLINVLFIEGSARYDYRYVKTLLERESAEDRRNKTIDLKVLLLDSGDEYAKQDKSALSEFPIPSELNKFDVVILGDADPRHPKLGQKHLAELANFVRERGGGILFLAGEHYNPHAYRDTPLRDILPIECLFGEQAELDHPDPYRPELTPLGRFHPIFRFNPDENENAAIWQKLSQIYWWSEGYKLKPGAEVLAVHPTMKAEAPRGGAEAEGHEMHPLIVQQFVGAGRALFFGINETWRWRFREDELRFNQFWIQTMRYLARSRVGRVELSLDRQVPYRRGEPIKVTVRFPDDMPEPPKETQVVVSVSRTTSDSPEGAAIEKWEEMKLEPVAGYRATYEGTLTRTPDGRYRFRLQSPSVTGTVPTAEARVVAPPDEMARLRMNQEEMERAAEETGGRFYNLADADHLIDDLPAGSRVTLHSPQPPRLLWNHPLLFMLALGLLTAEWFLRKRRHLL
jgi:hypothetical protein